MTPFERLVRRVQQRGRKPGSPPVTITELAERCGLSRVSLHRLMAGSRGASEWVEEAIATGLELSLRTVREALSTTRRRPRSVTT